MSRCHERGGWVADGETEDDIDERARGLRKLTYNTGNPFVDSVLMLCLEREYDVQEMLASRRKMKVHLARYLHLGTTDEDMGWGNVEVRELRRIYQELVEVLKAEGPSAGLES